MKRLQRLSKKIFSRPVIVTLALVSQVMWLVIILYFLSSYFAAIHLILETISLLVVVWIINTEDNPNIKLAWIIPIILVPWFGGVLFLITGGPLPTKGMRDKVMNSIKESNGKEADCREVLEEIEQQNPYVAGQMQYLKNMHFPVYRNSGARYYPMGENMIEDMLDDLRTARKFIFMEYFIVRTGEMWDSIHEILKEKAAAGVEIRLIIDDFGSINVPDRFAKKLEQEGIRCYTFNPYIPIYSVVMNNRDHRKILVIDGEIGYTGGINIADEYINRIERFGVWKDIAVRIEGDAVWSLTLMFLSMWNVKKNHHVVYSDKYRPRNTGRTIDMTAVENGYAAPYGHCPYNKEYVAERVYLNMIGHARRYVYIYTPYLGLDHEMYTELALAAKRGVDVRLITPGIPDKKIVNALTKSEYVRLMEAGVAIYEYTPGFVHAKGMVCDDELVAVGTVNLDYRSLYHHFENGIVFYKGNVPVLMRQDFEETLKKCKRVRRTTKRMNVLADMFYALLRLFSPLL